MIERQQKLINWIVNNDIDICFIQSKDNIFYLSNMYSEPHERLNGLFFFKSSEPFLICPQMEVDQVKAAGWQSDVVGYGDHENPWNLIKAEFERRNLTSINKLAIEKEVTNYYRVEQLQNIIKDQVEIIAVDSTMNEHRVVKDEKEINILKQAAELADYGVEVGVSALKEGITELEVLAKIEYELKKKGIREMSFSTMVLFGENSGLAHGNPGLNKLQKGDFVLFDLGVVLDGYCSDITRTVMYQSYNEQQKDIYDTVLKAQLSALNESKIGTRIGDLDKLARGIIAEAGYGDYFPHRLGHGLGISVHEYPSMNMTNNELIKEGMVYTIEPGIYIPEIGGVRIEDDVLITKGGHQTLTNYPKEFTVIK